MQRASLVVVLLALAAFVAACGSSSKATKGSDAPRGALSKQEYGLMVRSARKFRKVKEARDLRTAIPRFRQVCGVFRNAPTELLQFAYYTCRSQLALSRALVRAAAAKSLCEAATQRGNFNCTLGRFHGLQKAAKAAAVTTGATERAARARGIRASCRALIGVPANDRRFYWRTTRALAAFRRATEALDVPKIFSAVKRLKRALNSLKDFHGDPVKRVRACRRR
jgi:hypothetical protein